MSERKKTNQGGGRPLHETGFNKEYQIIWD